MRMSVTDELNTELLDATDAVIEDAVEYADPMILRGLLYQLTGDEEVAATHAGLRPRAVTRFPEILGDADKALIRRKAADLLKKLRDSGTTTLPPGTPDTLPRAFRLTTGLDLTDEEMGLWEEELA